VEILRLAKFRSGLIDKRRVWRVTADAPMGKYVDSDAAPLAAAEPDHERHAGWVVSTSELMAGLDVIDTGVPVPEGVPAPTFDKPRLPGRG
jgi:hypothetical protein